MLHQDKPFSVISLTADISMWPMPSAVPACGPSVSATGAGNFRSEACP